MAEEDGLLDPTEPHKLIKERRCLMTLGPGRPQSARHQACQRCTAPKQRARLISPTELKLCQEYVKELLQKSSLLRALPRKKHQFVQS